jgi:hypothetical protein
MNPDAALILRQGPVAAAALLRSFARCHQSLYRLTASRPCHNYSVSSFFLLVPDSQRCNRELPAWSPGDGLGAGGEGSASRDLQSGRAPA